MSATFVVPAKRSSQNASQRAPELRVVDDRRVAGDDAEGLQAVDAPLHGGRRERDALADVGEGPARVLASAGR